MANKKAERLGRIGVISKHAGALMGRAAAIGRSIASFGVKSVATAGSSVGGPAAGATAIACERGFSQPAASRGARPRARRAAGGETDLIAITAELRTDLSKVELELANARGQAEKAESELSSQLRALQAEKESLIADLQIARHEAVVATGRESELDLAAATLRDDLSKVELELVNTRADAERAASEFASQLRTLQAERESLLADLQIARHEAEEAKGRESAVKARVAGLEADLAAANKLRKATSTPSPAPSVQVQPAPSTAAEPPLTAITPAPSDQSAEATGDLAAHQQPFPAEPAAAAEPTDADLDEQANVELEAQPPSPPPPAGDAPSPSDVSPEDVRQAAFSEAAQRIMFTRALADIANQDPAARSDAAKALAGIDHELSVKVLVAHMACEQSAGVRQECVKALTELGMIEALPAVKRALADPSASVRLAAVWGVYRLAGDQSAPALAEAIADEDEGVRRRAATCIGWLGKEEFAVKLVPLLADSSAAVRRAAVEAAENLHSKNVISALIGRLNDPEESIRKAVMHALETITGKKMSKTPPKTKKTYQRVVARWQQWWKVERQG